MLTPKAREKNTRVQILSSLQQGIAGINTSIIVSTTLVTGYMFGLIGLTI